MLTDSELKDLKRLHGQMTHLMSEEDIVRRSDLWIKATDEDMAKIIGPQPKTTTVVGTLVRLENGQLGLHANSAHYADDEHYVATPLRNSGHTDGYLIPPQLQDKAETLFQQDSVFILAEVQNNTLGSPVGPVLDLTHE